MIISELRSLPVTPKLKFLPLTRRSNVIPQLHSGQKVTTIGIPLTMSLTIGNLIIARSGYKMRIAVRWDAIFRWTSSQNLSPVLNRRLAKMNLRPFVLPELE
jgi:hypothetical protein